MNPISQAKIEELRSSVAHATFNDIDAEVKEGGDPKLIEDMTAYLHKFAARKLGDDGRPLAGNPCICCGYDLCGGMVGFLMGSKGGFKWGLAHGEGYCSECGWPARLYHFVKDRDGKDLLTFRHVVLQYHPDGINVREKETA